MTDSTLITDVRDYKNCSVGQYHNFKVDHTDDKQQVEHCRYCLVRKTYVFKEDGRMLDDHEYYRDHIRAFAQPWMACYYEINPDAEAKAEAKRKALMAFGDRQEDLKEKFNVAIKKALE